MIGVVPANLVRGLAHAYNDTIGDQRAEPAWGHGSSGFRIRSRRRQHQGIFGSGSDWHRQA